MMRSFKPLALSIIAILFASCKASQPTGPSGTTSSASLADVENTLDSTGIMFAQFNNAAGATPQQAIIQTENWLKTQPNVQSVADIDSFFFVHHVTVRADNDLFIRSAGSRRPLRNTRGDFK